MVPQQQKFGHVSGSPVVYMDTVKRYKYMYDKWWAIRVVCVTGWLD